MTKAERRIDEEIRAITKKQCNGRELCEGCKHFKKREDFIFGCFHKIAIDLIIEARRETVDKEKLAKNNTAVAIMRELYELAESNAGFIDVAEVASICIKYGSTLYQKELRHGNEKHDSAE